DEITYERLYRINHGKGTKNESFKWAEKHLPYLSNLNVFKVKKFDISINAKTNYNEVIKTLLKETFSHFNITHHNLDNNNLLRQLLALQPYEEEQDATK
ncbi:site-specific DNA-methyltransferase, partial [Ureaplasma zalophigenitalium]|nr:site-specific DNA-methyltransferase [Ureaplasma zalophigenitalium]